MHSGCGADPDPALEMTVEEVTAALDDLLART